MLAIGTRLQDFVTGSWSVFAGDARLIALNAARFDAVKHRALSVVGDALVGLEELSEALADWRAPDELGEAGHDRIRDLERAGRQALRSDQRGSAELCPGRRRDQPHLRPDRSCADRRRRPARRALQELAGEVGRHLRLRVRLLLHGLRDLRRAGAPRWRTRTATSSPWSATARTSCRIPTSIPRCSTGHKLIVVVCDNGGFAVINRLQNFKGSKSFNNLIADCRVGEPGRGRLPEARRIDGRPCGDRPLDR